MCPKQQQISVTWMCLERYEREACKNDSNIRSVISISGGQLHRIDITDT